MAALCRMGTVGARAQLSPDTDAFARSTRAQREHGVSALYSIVQSKLEALQGQAHNIGVVVL